jgi:hypothetical protein
MFYLILLVIIISILIISLFIYLHNNFLNNNIEFSNIETNCLYRRWGCCNDKITPKYDDKGSNCRGF